MVCNLHSVLLPRLTESRIRCCFEKDPKADITQVALWQAYSSRFKEFASAEKPLLHSVELVQNVAHSFHPVTVESVSTNQGTRYLVKGIRVREAPVNTEGQVYLACKWLNTTGSAASKCTAQLPTASALGAHIIELHLKPSVNSDDSQLYSCQWAGCHHFASQGPADIGEVIEHICAHLPKNRIPPIPINPGYPYGITLTAALTLENIWKLGGLQAKTLIHEQKDCLSVAVIKNESIAMFLSDFILDVFGDGIGSLFRGTE